MRNRGMDIALHGIAASLDQQRNLTVGIALEHLAGSGKRLSRLASDQGDLGLAPPPPFQFGVDRKRRIEIGLRSVEFPCLRMELAAIDEDLPNIRIDRQCA